MTALSGIRVLDFSRVLAGPLCSMILGDLGADVIKVENPKTGDETRAWGPPWAGDQSAYYLSVNRNKRSITLDLKSESDQKIAKALTKTSHIIIENFKPGQMQTFNLSYETLHAINPSLVICSITGFGQTGLYSNRPGYDFVIQAMSGLMSITGNPNDEPHKVGVAVSDVFTALYACNAILAALRHAERTGEGQHIDMALLDSQIAALVNIGSNFLISGKNPPRYGNQHQNIVPYQVFHAADGAFVLAVGNDRQFEALCNLINRPDLYADSRYSTNPARVINRDSLIETLSNIFKRRSVNDWVDELLRLNIPVGHINTIEEALTDEHIKARGMIESVTLSNGETVPLIHSPLHLSATPPSIRYPPPLLGEHTNEIIQELVDRGVL
ncbi:MAG: CoA transferase [Phototrophicales bacterium]|nr:MAG: CoA transferase [Phototrophicales bacterium]RMG74802.1 MAG: CoA transferase [Chloroflexota bacterium]